MKTAAEALGAITTRFPFAEIGKHMVATGWRWPGVGYPTRDQMVFQVYKLFLAAQDFGDGTVSSRGFEVHVSPRVVNVAFRGRAGEGSELRSAPIWRATEWFDPEPVAEAPACPPDELSGG